VEDPRAKQKTGGEYHAKEEHVEDDT
jgi:hypothetical protein